MLLNIFVHKDSRIISALVCLCPLFSPGFILPKSTSFFSFAHKRDFYRHNIRKIRWKRGNPLGIDVRCEKSKVEAEDIFFSDRFAIFAKKSRNVAFFTIFEDVLGIFPTSFLTFLSTISPRCCFLSIEDSMTMLILRSKLSSSPTKNLFTLDNSS